MKRRDLLKGIGAIPLLAGTMFAESNRGATKRKTIKPKRLKASDTVGMIAPAGVVDEEEFNRAFQNLQSLGFNVKVGKNARNQKSFLAGTDSERLADFHWAFADPDIKAVWCIRGGYGATRILPEINFDLIRKNPKILIGYSDITALAVAVSQQTGLVTFHGPVASSNYSDYTKTHALNTLMNPTAQYKVELSADNKANQSAVYRTETIVKGKCRGRITGGNLSLIAALCGTRNALHDTKGKILFLEDVNEAPYRVDRMLTQLGQNIDLRQLAGIALGIFEDASSRKNPAEVTVNPQMEVLQDRLGDLGIPVVYGLSFGHIRNQFTIPIGIEAELNADEATVTFLEAAVG